MKKIFKFSFFFVGTVSIIILLLYFNNDIGITKLNIEKHARNSQKISHDWQVTKDTTETISAMLFYDKSHKKHTFSIYVNRHGLTFGYFFRGGGATGVIAEGIAEFYIDGYNERAFISMNKQQVSKVEINNGNSVQTIEIESTKPFAFILPVNIGSVTIYDINGNIIESQQQKL
jgi:hypothetical protein